MCVFRLKEGGCMYVCVCLLWWEGISVWVCVFVIGFVCARVYVSLDGMGGGVCTRVLCHCRNGGKGGICVHVCVRWGKYVCVYLSWGKRVVCAVWCHKSVHGGASCAMCLPPAAHTLVLGGNGVKTTGHYIRFCLVLLAEKASPISKV